MSRFVRGTTNPQVFFVPNGARRAVPDAATLAFMSVGQTVSTLSDADLAAIPLGPGGTIPEITGVVRGDG